MADQTPLTLEEVMSTQRAIRRLKTDPVDDALVLHLIELALKAPTGSNAQNWEFIIVKDPAVKARLAQLNRRAWGVYGGLGRLLARRSGDETMGRIIKAVQWQADHFEEIPVIVVACLKTITLPWPPIVPASQYGSIFPSVQKPAGGGVCVGHTLVCLSRQKLPQQSGAPAGHQNRQGLGSQSQSLRCWQFFSSSEPQVAGALVWQISGQGGQTPSLLHGAMGHMPGPQLQSLRAEQSP